jgi:hypothetical protein
VKAMLFSFKEKLSALKSYRRSRIQSAVRTLLNFAVSTGSISIIRS